MSDVGKALCHAWGLDPFRVRRIVIDLSPGDEQVRVTMQGMGDAAHLLARYRLEEIEAADD